MAAHTAEKELIRRWIECFRRLGHEAVEVELTDELIAHAPDLVINTHHLIPKTTDIFTVGMLWDPPVFFMED